MKIKRNIFIAVLIGAALALFFYAPKIAFSRIETNVSPDIGAEQLKALVVEDFEDDSKIGPEDGWRITTVPAVLKDPNRADKNPVDVLVQKIIPGRPSDMRPDVWSPNNKGVKNKDIDKAQKVYGIHFRFKYPGYNSVSIEPPVNPELRDEKDRPTRGIMLPGKARGLSIWVHSRGNEYKLEGWIQDYKGNVHILKFGSLDFVGWRPLKAYIPRNIPQAVDTYPQTKYIKLVRFVIRAEPDAGTEHVYMFFDQLRVLTDDYEVNFDGQDLDKAFGNGGASSQKTSTTKQTK